MEEASFLPSFIYSFLRSDSNVSIVMAPRLFQSRHITPTDSAKEEEEARTNTTDDTRRSNKSAAGVECMNGEREGERERARRHNAHRECTEQRKQPYKALVRGREGGREAVLPSHARGILRELRGVITAHVGNPAAAVHPATRPVAAAAAAA